MSHKNLFSTEPPLKKLKTDQEKTVPNKDILLPIPILNIILEYSKIPHSHFFNGQSSNNLLNLHDKIIDYRRPLIKKLHSYIVRGAIMYAEGIIKNNPEILFEKGVAIDYSGRTIKGTALQMALGACDVDFRSTGKGMVEMILSYLMTMDNGKLFIEEEIKKQFPEGWDEKEAAKNARDLKALNHVFQAISNSKERDPCEVSLKTFHKYLDNQSKIMITAGKHFNGNLLTAALKFQKENYSRWGGWKSHKNCLYWRQVIGYIQRFLPACDAQAFCTPLSDFEKGGKKLERNIILYNNYGIKKYRLFLRSLSFASLWHK